MKTIGRRTERQLSAHPDGVLLAEGAHFTETMSAFAPASSLPKGLYRFRSHDEAVQHQHDCLAQAMSRVAMKQSRGECARPATLNDLKMLFGCLNEHQVNYLLVGGHSLNACGNARSTADIDVLIEQGAETGSRVRKALMELPDQVAKNLDPAWFASGDRVRVADAFQVDLMVNAGGQTWDSLRRFEEVINVQGIPVKALCLEGLLLTRTAL